MATSINIVSVKRVPSFQRILNKIIPNKNY